jgi:hypothetical protein
MALFSKIAVRIPLDAHIRNIVVLTGGKLTGIYILHLFPVTTHLCQGKNVSILPSSDVIPEPVPSRRGLLEDIPYRAVGVVCPSCDES